MLDAFGIGLGGFARHAEREQHFEHQTVPGAHPLGERVTLLGQEDAR